MESNYQNIIDRLLQHDFIKAQRNRRRIIVNNKKRIRDLHENGVGMNLSKKNNSKRNIGEIFLANNIDLVYAHVEKLLGSCHLEATCFEEKDGFLIHRKCLCHICGKMFNKSWVYENNIVLVSLRDFEYNKADVLYKYSKDEADYLKSKGNVPKYEFEKEIIEKKPKSKRLRRMSKFSRKFIPTIPPSRSNIHVIQSINNNTNKSSNKKNSIRHEKEKIPVKLKLNMIINENYDYNIKISFTNGDTTKIDFKNNSKIICS